MENMTDNERYGLLQNSMVASEVNRIGDITLRPMTLGSLLQLQRIGSPFGGLSPEGVDEKDPQSLYYMGELAWLHAEEPGEVSRNLQPDLLRREAVERFCQKITLQDLPEVTRILTSGMVNNQAAMVTPQSDTVDDPNGHGPAGVRP